MRPLHASPHISALMPKGIQGRQSATNLLQVPVRVDLPEVLRVAARTPKAPQQPHKAPLPQRLNIRAASRIDKK
jgi:hypothetical protein